MRQRTLLLCMHKVQGRYNIVKNTQSGSIYQDHKKYFLQISKYNFEKYKVTIYLFVKTSAFEILQRN